MTWFEHPKSVTVRATKESNGWRGEICHDGIAIVEPPLYTKKRYAILAAQSMRRVLIAAAYRFDTAVQNGAALEFLRNDRPVQFSKQGMVKE